MVNLDRTKAPMVHHIKNIDVPIVNYNTLDNGVKVCSLNGPDTGIIKLVFSFNAGYQYQAQSLLAFVTTALLKSGTIKLNSNEINEQLDYYGSYFETFTSYKKSGFGIYILEPYFEDVLNIIKEAIFSCIFPKQEFELLVKKSTQSIKKKLSQVDYVSSMHFNNALLGSNSPLGQVIEADVYKKLSLDMVKDYFSTYYKTHLFDILYTGELCTEKLSILNRLFGEDELIQTAEGASLFDSKHIITPYKLIEQPEAIQSGITVGLTMPSVSHPDFFKLKLLNFLLGGYFGSRLMQRIREEKGYTYGIYSQISQYDTFSVLSISTQVDNEYVEPTLVEIDNILQDFRTKPVTDLELNMAKNYLLAQILKSFGNIYKTSNVYQSLYNKDQDFTYYSKYIKTIRHTFSKELCTLAEKYFSEKSIVKVIAGNNK